MLPMTSPVRILYHNPAMASSRNWAGERGRQLVAAMRGAGATVEAVPAFESGKSSGARRRGWKRPTWEHLPCQTYGAAIRLSLILRGTLNSILWTWRLWRKLSDRPPDVVLARYRKLEWTPLLVSRLLRRPLVLEVHSPAAIEHVLLGGRRSRYLTWMDRQMFRRADLVWVHTPELEQLVTQVGHDGGRIRLIPFGIEDPGVRANPASTTSGVDVAYVGSFFPWHGVSELVVAFARASEEMPRMRLTMMGDGIARRECEELAARLGLDDRVVFTGWLRRSEMYERLRRSQVGVAPYQDTEYDYYQPVKILDYEMAGLPIVASAVGHIPAMVADGESGLLVPPGDVDGLADALVRLANNPGLRASMGSMARRRAQSINDTAAAVVKICESAALT
jgi:glycosyltransferase involved in cell wall biosynthesis